MSKSAQEKVKLPENWWDQLVEHYQRWDYETLEEFCNDIPTISSKTLYRAKAEGWMTARTLERLARKMDYITQNELLTAWKNTTPKDGHQLLSQNPKTFVLRTNDKMLAGTDFRPIYLGSGRLEVVRCKIETESPYFRFGFKLLKENGKLFGDDSITTSDENRIVHIGRNNWDRLNIGVLAKDIFITTRLNGVRLKRNDEKMFSARRSLSASVELRIDSNYIMTFSVNDTPYMCRPISPEICRRIVVAAWGDGEDYEVKVSDFMVNPVSGP